MAKCKGKGSSFEREIAKRLSLWWTNGKRDDVFWRTDNSGGRATSRRKQGKETFGQSGDLQATDPIGQRLLDFVSIEIKRGYAKNTVADMLDKAPNAAIQAWELWVIQASSDALHGKSQGWMLITRRDRRRTLVFIPWWVHCALIDSGSDYAAFDVRPSATISLDIGGISNMIFVCTLDNFLEHVKPKHIKRANRKLKTKEGE